MNHQFGKSNRRAGKKSGIFYGRWLLAWMICLAMMLWGCGVSGGGDQITKMDERYLAGQEGQSPSPETGSSEAGGQTEGAGGGAETPEGEGEGNSPQTGHPQQSFQPGGDVSSKSTKGSADKAADDKSNQSTSRPSKKNKSRTSNSKSESKKSSAKNNKTISRQSSNVKHSPSIEREDKEPSQEEDFGDKGKREEEKKDGEGIHCFVSIDCENILSHMSKLKESKKDYVPKDGIILKKTKVTVKPGTSAYDVLYQVCRERNIHLEAAYTPMYGTYYVEGIHQLYEFDCGDLSGWNYTVNGRQPGRGCSKYQVQEGDVIAWRFTCDRGKDL